jgi:hypothetical protein
MLHSLSALSISASLKYKVRRRIKARLLNPHAKQMQLLRIPHLGFLLLLTPRSTSHFMTILLISTSKTRLPPPPLAADTQVNFTFYDDPAYLNFKNATTSTSIIIQPLKSKPANPLSFLRVSTPIWKHFPSRSLFIPLNFFCICSSAVFLPKKISNQVTLLDSGLSDLSAPFDIGSNNPANAVNTPDFFVFYGSNSYDT